MQEAWLSLARTGDPSHPGLPSWPRYAPPERSTMVFDAACTVEESRFEDVRRLWESIRTDLEAST